MIFKRSDLAELKKVILSGTGGYDDPDLNSKYRAIEKIAKFKSDEAEAMLHGFLDQELPPNIGRAVVLELKRFPTDRTVRRLLEVLEKEKGFVYGGAIFTLCTIYQKGSNKDSFRIELMEILISVLSNLEAPSSSEELAAIADSLKDVKSEKIDVALDNLKGIDEGELGREKILSVIDYRSSKEIMGSE